MLFDESILIQVKSQTNSLRQKLYAKVNINLYYYVFSAHQISYNVINSCTNKTQQRSEKLNLFRFHENWPTDLILKSINFFLYAKCLICIMKYLNNTFTAMSWRACYIKYDQPRIKLF